MFRPDFSQASPAGKWWRLRNRTSLRFIAEIHRFALLPPNTGSQKSVNPDGLAGLLRVPGSAVFRRAIRAKRAKLFAPMKTEQPHPEELDLAIPDMDSPTAELAVKQSLEQLPGIV